MNAISLLIILTLLQVLYSLDTNESKSDNVITIDIEWVYQLKIISIFLDSAPESYLSVFHYYHKSGAKPHSF